jgi:mannose-1-phosphate guanylyltransferase/mannose-6-phosphate isomerase
LSTPEYPKHLLALTGEKPLLSYVYDRSKAVAGGSVYVVTEAGHAHHVKHALSELPEDHFIIEPGRRGTASCIVAALHDIAKKHDADEPIAFLAADHYIRDTQGFVQSFKVAGHISKETGRIVLIGVEPDHPATGFGYIHKGETFDDEALVFDVSAFKEKPDHQTAQDYVSSGEYLWNCGYFVGSVNAFIKSMESYAPGLKEDFDKLNKATSKEEFEKTYLQFENISIDYALIEKVKNLLVIPATFDWMDLGSYGDLHKAVGNDEAGNHIQGNNVEIAGVENSLIRNQEDKPMAVIGLDNVAVINTPQGLLVTRKDLAQQVGEISKRFSTKKQ